MFEAFVGYVVPMWAFLQGQSGAERQHSGPSRSRQWAAGEFAANGPCADGKLGELDDVRCHSILDYPRIGSWLGLVILSNWDLPTKKLCTNIMNASDGLSLKTYMVIFQICANI